jgi:hypothetical protein
MRAIPDQSSDIFDDIAHGDIVEFAALQTDVPDGVLREVMYVQKLWR